MKIKDFDTDKSIFIIAEIGNNHEGDFDNACRLVEEASKTGVDAVKFQSIIPEKLVSSDQTQRINQLRKFQLSLDQYQQLAKLANKLGVYFMSTPFDLEMVDFLEPLVPAFKISSGDNDHYPLLEKVAKTDKPVIVSSGMAGMAEMSKMYDYLSGVWAKQGSSAKERLSILHCVSNYPTLPEHAHISALSDLTKSLNCTIGYSDHTIGCTAAVLSVGFGARIIEKHFTLNNNFSDFRDHKVAANPETMRQLVLVVREAEKMVGNATKRLGENEVDASMAARRSVAAAVEILKGDIITYDKLTWVRPGTGIRPGMELKIIGKSSKKDIPKGHLIMEGDIQ